MVIVSSQITLNNLQDDNRRVIREVHTDDQGNAYQIDYMADASMDINLNLANHATALDQNFINQEDMLGV